MSYSDLRDFEPEAVHFFEVDGSQTRIEIAKMGGGAVGRSYTGRWEYVVTCDGTEVKRGNDFNTSTYETHRSAAKILFRMLSNEL